MATNCCPQGYYYVSSTGSVSDPSLGLYNGKTIVNRNASSFYNTCVTLNVVQNNEIWAIASGQDAIDCPCCPDGYSYSSYKGYCSTPGGKSTSSIPCVTCNCVAPPVPECGSCGTSGLSVHFSFNPFTRQCTDCILNQENGVVPKGKINCFLPSNYTNPPLNFIISIKNLL